MTEDGYLSIVDRKKDMIKTGGDRRKSRGRGGHLRDGGRGRGRRLRDRHPRWVEAVIAVVVLKDGASLTTEDIRAHAKQRLAGYKRPKYVVLAAELPKNPSGKILKRELRQQYAGFAHED